MMRVAAYAGTSMVLAVGVVVQALHQRANFYSASVYVAQSNACLMVLANLLLLGVSVFMIALQRLAYGPLRVIEIEQLYEKAWFAITETCLAMTIFREEVGGWFFVMFVSLLIGKVWGWLGEGRLEILEQQPPQNPRLFHLRLSFSLALTVLFDVLMLKYSIQTIRAQAQPNMTVMFAFEFAVLSVTSLSSVAKYAIFLRERTVIQQQTRARRQERLAADRNEGNEATETTSNGGDTAVEPRNSEPGNNDMEHEEVDVPGWETKGFWIFYLDIFTDFLKLVLYLSFFSILCIFYGMPLHIIRDVAITIRSFYKRIHDFLRYRQATKDMNERYADATGEEIVREDVCIICRETMTVWMDEAQAGGVGQPTSRQQDHRLRPKKLPCGHILHFACLRSWLERQQSCPICRRPVVNTSSLVRIPQIQAQNQQNGPLEAIGQGGFPPVAINAQPQRQNRVRTFNFGPFRLGIGAGHDLQGLANQMNRNDRPIPQNQTQPANPLNPGNFGPHQGTTIRLPHSSPDTIQRQLQAIEQQLTQQISTLQIQADQLYLVRALQGELARIRMNSQSSSVRQPIPENYYIRPSMTGLPASATPFEPFGAIAHDPQSGVVPQSLPQGLTLPDGWSLMPLRRISDGPSGPTTTLGADSHSQSNAIPRQSTQTTQASIPHDLGATASRNFSTQSSRSGAETNPTSADHTGFFESGSSQTRPSSAPKTQSPLCNDAEQIDESANTHSPQHTGLLDHENVHSPYYLATRRAATSAGPPTARRHATVENHDDDST